GIHVSIELTKYLQRLNMEDLGVHQNIYKMEEAKALVNNNTNLIILFRATTSKGVRMTIHWMHLEI
ncbi:hypothetical protein SGI37_20720, partial [Providencia rettgeri]